MQDIRYIWIWHDRLNFRPCLVFARARAHISEQRLVIKPSHGVAHLRVTSCGLFILLKRPCSWFLAVRDSSLGSWDSFFLCPTQPRSKEHLSLFEFKAYHPHSLHAHDALDTAYPSSMRDAYHSRICDSVIEYHYQALNLPSFLFHLGSVLVGHVISSFQVSSRFDCAFECLKNELCISYNYQEGNQALHGCELNNQDKGNKPDNFTNKEGFSYYEKRVSNLNLKNLYKNLYVSFNWMSLMWTRSTHSQYLVNVYVTNWIYIYIYIFIFKYLIFQLFLFIFISFLFFLKFFKNTIRFLYI